ncbi:MAG: bifunctional phosphoribosylaminoimidazolecarboxamide formyltransferase/IMP cyclohydrolase [Deltaproteobacteria bacterium]|nr:bifunctional phosphoribosylaminoimidazolecarboxamide formyltransferase/IMP cyclohydrolase [Deltaproteobacteria bacterium]
MTDAIVIRRALLSVSDKTGVVELARALAAHGCELISTGGTRRVLEDAGLSCTDIAAFTGNPEAFGGRMKTISFAIGAALLFDREADAEEARRLGIRPIDLVACNLYPFERVRDEGGDLARLVEHIDVGGPTMIRAAAKNHRWVGVLTDPGDYPAVIEELAASGGALGAGTRSRLMRKAFARTADYDAAIATTMDALGGTRTLRLAFDHAVPLRYGENAHQPAVLMRQRGAAQSLCDLEVLGGKALSFNNLTDVQAALEAVMDLPVPACAVVKHQNPCGLAMGSPLPLVFAAAWEGDPLSAFGSVIAFNRDLSLEAARFLALDGPKRDRRFVEVVVAPGFHEGVLEYLRGHESLRVLRAAPDLARRHEDVRILAGAALVQAPDAALWERLETVTAAAPGPVDEELLAFGTVAARQVKSNAVVVVRRRRDGICQLLGMGAGQPNRLDSTRLAVDRSLANLAREGDGATAREALASCYLVSDAFFPFPDNVELAASAGLRILFQPGGSIRDRAVIERCDALGLAMVFTGTRHFRH